MQHALARQAEAERNRRAKVINAEGEFQAADRLADAAEVIRPNPVTIQLRYLQALSEISANQGTTIVFPLPMDVLRPLIEAGTGNGAEASELKRPESPAGSHELTEGEAGQGPERELTEGEPATLP
jgi:hypothetical protein